MNIPHLLSDLVGTEGLTEEDASGIQDYLSHGDIQATVLRVFDALDKQEADDLSILVIRYHYGIGQDSMTTQEIAKKLVPPLRLSETRSLKWQGLRIVGPRLVAPLKELYAKAIFQHLPAWFREKFITAPQEEIAALEAYAGVPRGSGALFRKSIDELQLSKRLANALRSENMFRIGDLMARSRKDILRATNSVDGTEEVAEALLKLGLRFPPE